MIEELKKKSKGLIKHLTFGTSYMINLLSVGGYFSLIKTLLSKTALADKAAMFGDINNLALALFVPVCAAFIAESIGEKKAFAPALVLGYYAYQNGTGFLGGIFVGYAVGFLTIVFKHAHIGKAMETWMAQLRPIFVSLIVFGITRILLIPVFTVITNAMNSALNGMLDKSPVLLGIVLGCLAGADFGGPINKVGFLYSMAMLGEGIYKPMAMTMAAACPVSIGLGLATIIKPSVFTKSERKFGKDSLVLGLTTGFSEGAIPFALNDLWRVTVSSIVGSAVAAAFAGFFGLWMEAPGSGIINGPLLVNNAFQWFISIGAGSLTVALVVILLKLGRKLPEEDEDDDDEDDD